MWYNFPKTYELIIHDILKKDVLFSWTFKDLKIFYGYISLNQVYLFIKKTKCFLKK